MTDADEARFECGNCGKSYRWSSALAGTKVPCACGHVMRVPKSEPKPAEPEPEEAEAAPLELADEAAPPVAAGAAGRGKRGEKDRPPSREPEPDTDAEEEEGDPGTFELAELEEEKPAGATECPSCGAEIPEGKRVCAQCGFNLITGEVVGAGKRKKRRAKSGNGEGAGAAEAGANADAAATDDEEAEEIPAIYRVREWEVPIGLLAVGVPVLLIVTYLRTASEWYDGSGLFAEIALMFAGGVLGVGILTAACYVTGFLLDLDFGPVGSVVLKSAGTYAAAGALAALAALPLAEWGWVAGLPVFIVTATILLMLLFGIEFFHVFVIAVLCALLGVPINAVADATALFTFLG